MDNNQNIENQNIVNRPPVRRALNFNQPIEGVLNPHGVPAGGEVDPVNDQGGQESSENSSTSKNSSSSESSTMTTAESPASAPTEAAPQASGSENSNFTNTTSSTGESSASAPSEPADEEMQDLPQEDIVFHPGDAAEEEPNPPEVEPFQPVEEPDDIDVGEIIFDLVMNHLAAVFTLWLKRDQDDPYEPEVEPSSA